MTESCLQELDWFFPGHVSAAARLLVLCMLQPEPQHRLSIQQAKDYCWVQGIEASMHASSGSRSHSPNTSSDQDLGSLSTPALSGEMQFSLPPQEQQGQLSDTPESLVKSMGKVRLNRSPDGSDEGKYQAGSGGSGGGSGGDERLFVMDGDMLLAPGGTTGQSQGGNVLTSEARPLGDMPSDHGMTLEGHSSSPSESPPSSGLHPSPSDVSHQKEMQRQQY